MEDFVLFKLIIGVGNDIECVISLVWFVVIRFVVVC